MNAHPITTEKVLKFLRRNGYESLPQYINSHTCNITISREVGLIVGNDETGTCMVEVVLTSRFSTEARVSEPFYTMEDFTDYFLNLGVV